MSKSTAKARAKAARNAFIENAQENGVAVSPVDALTVEWRFADGDPEAPTIRTSFITRAEADAILEEAQATPPPVAPSLFLLHRDDDASVARAQMLLRRILKITTAEALA